MKYICLNNIKRKIMNYKYEITLTRGKNYRIIFKDTDFSNQYFLIEDDNNHRFCIDEFNFLKNNFGILDEWRNNQLNKLGI
jgi:hypothetical protein